MIARHATMSKYKHPFLASALEWVQMESQHLICMSTQKPSINYAIYRSWTLVNIANGTSRDAHIKCEELEPSPRHGIMRAKFTCWRIQLLELCSLLKYQEIRHRIVYKFPYSNRDTCNSSQHSACSDATQETYNISIKIGE